MSFPPFAEAQARLATFLRAQGWPDRIVWLDARDVVIVDQVFVVHQNPAPPQIVADRYEQAVARGFGVELRAIAFGPASSFCSLWSPTDAREAEEALQANDLKVSVPEPPRRARVVENPIQWWWLSRRGQPWPNL